MLFFRNERAFNFSGSKFEGETSLFVWRSNFVGMALSPSSFEFITIFLVEEEIVA